MLTLSLVAFLAGASETPAVHGARLLGDHAWPIGSGLLVAQADLPPAPPMVAPPRTLADLQREYTELERSRPRIGGWIAMMSVGTPLAAVFTAFTVSLLSISGSMGFNTLVAIFTGAVAFIGAALASVGTIFLIVMVVKRGRSNDQLEAVRRQMDEQERLAPPAAPPGYYPPPGNYPPPPPPPPPSSVEGASNRPLIALLSF
jgi:hypothetical protein